MIASYLYLKLLVAAGSVVTAALILGGISLLKNFAKTEKKTKVVAKPILSAAK